jgi:hypothetical protein
MRVHPNKPLAVPAGNIRVPLADFEAVLRELERWEVDRSQPNDPYKLGVLDTLQWLHGQPVMFDGEPTVPRPPLTFDYTRATPESIQAEYEHALAEFGRGQYTQGVRHALDWAWNGNRKAAAPAH